MNYKADTPVKVFNHSISSINLPGQFREYYLEGSRGVPTVLTMPFSDVEYINSRTPVFRNGRVQFDEMVFIMRFISTTGRTRFSSMKRSTASFVKTIWMQRRGS